jgi:hypothetical protein
LVLVLQLAPFISFKNVKVKGAAQAEKGPTQQKIAGQAWYLKYLSRQR